MGLDVFGQVFGRSRGRGRGRPCRFEDFEVAEKQVLWSQPRSQASWHPSIKVWTRLGRKCALHEVTLETQSPMPFARRQEGSMKLDRVRRLVDVIACVSRSPSR
jgi:hypothetical protein